MSTPIRAAALAAVAALCFATSASAAVFAAKQYSSSLTNPPSATGATISLTKASKITVKVGTGTVTFQLKLAGVLDNTSIPVTNTSNTLQIDFLRPGGGFVTQMFLFDLTNGKVSQKFPVANSALQGGALNPGEAIEIRAVRVIQSGNGNAFGVSGLTLK